MNWIDCEVCLFSEQCDGPDYAPLCMDFDDDYDFDGYCDDSNPSQGVVGDRAPVIPEVTANTPSYLYEFIFEACEYFSSAGYICNASEVFSVISDMRGKVNIKRLLSTMLVHSYQESAAFDKIYSEFLEKYYYRHREEREAKDEHEKNKKKMNEKLQRLTGRQQELKQQQEEGQKESKEVRKAEQTQEQQKGIKNLEECLEGQKSLKEFVKIVKSGIKPEQSQLMREVKAASMKACTKPNSSEIMAAIRERGKQLKAIKEEAKSLSTQIAQTENDIKTMQKRMQEEDAKFQRKMNEIVKEQSNMHRAEFNKALARNAVRSKHAGDIVLDKDFAKMNDAEKRQIADYIKDNARKFRTKMSRKIRANRSSKIDIPATIKKSCQTGGIPLRLIHQKPVRQKSNLILILDVSGSCKNASEMMLVFMHAMKEVFPGGCKTYAFTNRLYDISKFFETDNPNEAVKAVMDAIPRAGAYSNYEIPFRTFYDEHMSEVTGDSYIYFIGDARNNKNASGEDYVKAIARKAKKAFWLNTEKTEEWNHGDSIIGTYAKYMTKVAQTVTPAELLGFLER